MMEPESAGIIGRELIMFFAIREVCHQLYNIQFD